MPAQYLLDTNTFIYIRRQRPLSALTHFQALRADTAGLSVISYGELSYGAYRSRNPDLAFRELARFTDLIQVLPMPAAAGPIYGDMRRTLEARGEIIGANDLWIAAHAIASDLILVTNNEREFRRVPGLTVENWIE